MLVEAIATSLLLLVGDPSISVLSDADLVTIERALAGLDASVADPSMNLRIATVMTNVRTGQQLGIRDLPIIGMALSRACIRAPTDGAPDPAACALMDKLR